MDGVIDWSLLELEIDSLLTSAAWEGSGHWSSTSRHINLLGKDLVIYFVKRWRRYDSV